MTDPERWLSSGDAPEGMSEMLSAAQATLPTAAQKTALAGTLGAGAGVFSLGPAAKLVLVGFVLAGGTWGISRLGETESAGTESGSVNSDRVMHPTQTTEAPETAPEIQPEDALDRVLAEPKPPSEQAVSSASPARTPETPSEASLIRQAKQGMENSPQWALSLLRKHERLYPTGLLAEERDALKLRVLKRLGESKKAAAEARKFREKHPGSLHHVP